MIHPHAFVRLDLSSLICGIPPSRAQRWELGVVRKVEVTGTGHGVASGGRLWYGQRRWGGHKTLHKAHGY